MKISHACKLFISLFFSFYMIFYMDLQTAAAEIQSEKPNAATAEVPVLMYHSLYKGGGNRWTIPPEKFEEDLKYLTENGYESVGVSDLVAFVYEGAPLPEKPIVLSFDDGHYNNYTKVMPLIEKYDMKIVLSIIGEPTDKWSKAGELDERYGHLSWDQISRMLESGRVELSNHTYNMHKNTNGRDGCKKKKGEELCGYERILTEDVSKLQNSIFEHFGFKPLCFAYPFGSKCPEALDTLKDMGFKMTLSCRGGMNHLTVGDVDCLFDMCRDNREPSKSAQKILESMETV